MKTKDFYNNLPKEFVCDCAYCKNYIINIKSVYPELDEYLSSIGVDIKAPHETSPIDTEDGYVEYLNIEYIVLGDSKDFKETEIGNLKVSLSESHPATPDELNEDHYVISVYPIRLKWNI